MLDWDPDRRRPVMRRPKGCSTGCGQAT